MLAGLHQFFKNTVIKENVKSVTKDKSVLELWTCTGVTVDIGIGSKQSFSEVLYDVAWPPQTRVLLVRLMDDRVR